MNYAYVEAMLQKHKPINAECLRIYTWLQNIPFITAYDVDLPTGPSRFEICETLDATSTQYSIYSEFFAVAIENYTIMTYSVDLKPKNKEEVFGLLLDNLENSHQNVHKLLLELFKKMAKYYDEESKTDQEMIAKVIGMPWTNRNKYQLLAILISTNCDALLSHSSFNIDHFMGGIQTGLTTHHLLAPSQTLVKAIKDKDPFKPKLIEIVARVLWFGEDQIADNLIKFWFSSFEPKLMEKVYTTMCQNKTFAVFIPTTSRKFYRLLMLRNAFKRVFKDHELDERVMNFACEIESVPTKIQIFHILIDNVHAEIFDRRRFQKILALLKFLQFNMCIKDSSFIDQHIMRKLPDVFNFLASMKMRNVEVLKEIFGIIVRDIYQYGIDLGTYESLSFSLKLLNIVLKQYFSDSGNRLSKKTNIEGNLSFGQYLKENQIWDVTSNEIFITLIKQVEGDEHSDISEMTEKMIVEHFISKQLGESFIVDGEKFVNWINMKVNETFKQKEISSAASTNRYYILKFEHLIHWSPNLANEELRNMIELTEKQFNMIEKDKDPVKSMEEGRHLFRHLDCVNYAIKRCKQVDAKRINTFMKEIMNHFLLYISHPKVPPTFEFFDEKLCKLLDRSTYKGPEMKQKLTLFIWFTIRSLSELTETVTKVCHEISLKDEEFEDEYFVTVENCIAINISILHSTCHKGIIDSASTAIGSITKIVSNEYSKYCNKTTEPAKSFHKLLVLLKGEIDPGKRPSSGDIRSSRGLIVLAHKIITNHSSFLRFPMESLLEVSSEVVLTVESQTSVKFIKNIKPIQLHLLAALIKDGNLVEGMLKHYSLILLSTLKAYKESTDFVVINALLQIIGAIIPKISNQKRHIMMGDEAAELNYESKAVTVQEFYFKFPHVFKMGMDDLENTNSKFPTTYIIILLELFSNFENRNAAVPEPGMMIRGPLIFLEFFSHSCEKIRFLSAKCFAQYIKIDETPELIKTNHIPQLFSSDANFVHSTIYAIRFMIQRYESNVKFVESFSSDKFMFSLRKETLNLFEEYDREFKGAHNFYIRYHLLRFLIFLGFSFNDDIIKRLNNENGLKSHFGYKMFAQECSLLQDKDKKQFS